LASVSASCVPNSTYVEVSGTITNNLRYPTTISISAIISYEAGGESGDDNGQVEALNPRQAKPFSFSVGVISIPSSCTLHWGALRQMSRVINGGKSNRDLLESVSPR